MLESTLGMPMRRAFSQSRPLHTRVPVWSDQGHRQHSLRGVMVGWEEHFFGMAPFVYQSLMHMWKRLFFLVLWDSTVWHIDHQRGRWGKEQNGAAKIGAVFFAIIIARVWTVAKVYRKEGIHPSGVHNLNWQRFLPLENEVSNNESLKGGFVYPG